MKKRSVFPILWGIAVLSVSIWMEKNPTMWVYRSLSILLWNDIWKFVLAFLFCFAVKSTVRLKLHAPSLVSSVLIILFFIVARFTPLIQDPECLHLLLSENSTTLFMLLAGYLMANGIWE